jgi:O-antigen/teichoic acid export membrane protein
MSEIVNQSLQKIAKGTSIIFVGTIIGLSFGFIGRVLLARFFTQVEYGIFSLGLVILNIFVLISLLGLPDGVTRQIAYYKGKNDDSEVKGVDIFSTIQIVFISSILLSLALFFASDILSTNIFHDSTLSMPLKIFAIAIPFSSLISIFVSIFRGFNRVKERVYFQDILRTVLFPLFLLPVIFIGLPFINTIYAFVASIMITCIAFVLYGRKKFPLLLKRGKNLAINLSRKELLFFSFPLLVISMLNMTMSWTDTLMLGVFKTTDIVGLYNGALLLASLIPIFHASVAFIYLPLAATLYSKKLINEMKRFYALLTRWVFLLTFPIFLIFFLYPDKILGSLLGAEYIKGSIALQILSLGFLIHVIFGPNGSTLTAMGEINIQMYFSFTSAITNIILNVALIPSLGITGASLATATSLFIVNLIYSVKLYSKGIHPFTSHYVKPVLFSVTFILVTHFVLSNVILSFWIVPIAFFIFVSICIFSVFLTKSLYKEDIELLLLLEKRTRLNLDWIKILFKKFS